MMRTRRNLRLAGLALLALGCGGGGGATTDLPAPGTAASITFDAAAAIVGVRASVRLTPTVLDAQGHNITPTAAIQWTTSDATLATVNDTGAVTGVKLGGPVTITATSNGHSASVSYMVTPARINITPSVSALAVTGTVVYTGVAVDGLDQPIEAGAITWASDNTNIATVDQTGLVTGVGPGNVLITATAGGRSSSLGLLVGVPSVYDGTFVTTTSPSVQLVVLFGSVVHFDGNFTPYATCSVSVTAALNNLISATGSMQIFLSGNTGLQLSAAFTSPESVTGSVRGPTPSQCVQGGVVAQGLLYGNFVAHK